MADKPEKTSHEDLDAALESEAADETPADKTDKAETTSETDEPEGEETPADQDVPEEPTDNDERSMLGRKVKGLSDELAEIKELLQQRPAQLETDDTEPEVVTDKADVLKIIQEHETTQKSQRVAYNETAERSLIDLGLEEDLDEQTHINVYQRAQKGWKVYTGDAKQDALINFKEALAQTYKAQLKLGKQPKNPLEKNKDKETPKNLGGGESTKSEKKAAAPVVLDDYAKEFVEKTGMKEESVKEALTGDPPTYLSGRI